MENALSKKTRAQPIESEGLTPLYPRYYRQVF